MSTKSTRRCSRSSESRDSQHRIGMFTQDDVAGGRKGAGNKTNRIVVATDGSPSSCAAIEVAVEWAVEHRAELTFVHVMPLVDVVNGLGLEFPGVATPGNSRPRPLTTST